MTTQNIAAAPPVSLEEYAALPKHPRYELVKGVLVELMAASEEHEHTGSLVNWRLSEHVFPNGLGRVYISNRGYVTGPDSPATSRMPDVSFMSNERLGRPDLFGKLYDGAPDLAVEILSDSNTPAEIARKITEYLNAGGKAVWVIDIDARIITVHTTDAPPLILTDADTIRRRRLPPRLRLPRRRPSAGRRRLDQRRPASQRDPVGQCDGRLQVAEQQEPAHQHVHPLGVVGDAGGQQQFNVAMLSPLVGVQVAPPPHVGIDRYLNGLAASTLPADQVDHGPSTLVANELGRLGRYFQLCAHIVALLI